MALNYLTYCKLCRISNPKHPGFVAPPLESLNTEESERFTTKLMEHVRQHHQDVLTHNAAQGAALLRFLNLCVFDFQDPSAVKARDNLRYELAKITRAFRLSDEKIDAEICNTLPDGMYTDTRGTRQCVIDIIKRFRDQLEERGEWSQEPEAETPALTPIIKP